MSPPPDEKTTVEIPSPPAWAIEMSQRFQEGIAQVRADIGLVSNDLGIVKERITVVERRQDDYDKRANANSERAKSQSQIDASQEAQLAQERAARAELATKVDAQAAQIATLVTVNQQQLALLTQASDAAKKVWANPAVKAMAAVIWTGIVAYLAKHGISIQ